MPNEEMFSDESIEAATDQIVEEVQREDILHNHIICPNNDIAHKAFGSFRKKLQTHSRFSDVIVDVSEYKLTEILTEPKYRALKESGLNKVTELCLAAAMFDNLEKLSIIPEEIVEALTEEIEGGQGAILVEIFRIQSVLQTSVHM